MREFNGLSCRGGGDAAWCKHERALFPVPDYKNTGEQAVISIGKVFIVGAAAEQALGTGALPVEQYRLRNGLQLFALRRDRTEQILP
jgi:hypothetical protein